MARAGPIPGKRSSSAAPAVLILTTPLGIRPEPGELAPCVGTAGELGFVVVGGGASELAPCARTAGEVGLVVVVVVGVGGGGGASELALSAAGAAALVIV